MIGSAVLDKVCPALPELEGDIFADTLGPEIQGPGIVKGPCRPVGLAAYHHQLDVIILFDLVVAIAVGVAMKILFVLWTKAASNFKK